MGVYLLSLASKRQVLRTILRSARERKCKVREKKHVRCKHMGTRETETEKGEQESFIHFTQL